MDWKVQISRRSSSVCWVRTLRQNHEFFFNFHFPLSQEVMEKARNRIRIRVANIMMALTAIACVFMIMSGKKAAERGESVQKENLDWHKEYNQKSTEEALAARKK